MKQMSKMKKHSIKSFKGAPGENGRNGACKESAYIKGHAGRTSQLRKVDVDAQHTLVSYALR